MDIKPVKDYDEPSYPTKEELLRNPNILKITPARWKNNFYVGMALTTVLMMMTGCASNQKEKNNASSEKGKPQIAPIFEHGNGRGSFGCSSVAPPSFLSEEEAFQVIQEEAKTYGLSFKQNNLDIKNVKVPETKYYLKHEGYNEDGGEINSYKKRTLQLDGYDSNKNIGFEFISNEDYDKWKAKESKMSTVEDYDFLTTAKLLQQGLKDKNEESTIGIFYNPMMNLDHDKLKDYKDFNAMQDAVNNLAKDELKKQVKDFLQWLQAQGII